MTATINHEKDDCHDNFKFFLDWLLRHFRWYLHEVWLVSVRNSM